MLFYRTCFEIFLIRKIPRWSRQSLNQGGEVLKNSFKLLLIGHSHVHAKQNRQ